MNILISRSPNAAKPQQIARPLREIGLQREGGLFLKPPAHPLGRSLALPRLPTPCAGWAHCFSQFHGVRNSEIDQFACKVQAGAPPIKQCESWPGDVLALQSSDRPAIVTKNGDLLNE